MGVLRHLGLSESVNVNEPVNRLTQRDDTLASYKFVDAETNAGPEPGPPPEPQPDPTRPTRALPMEVVLGQLVEHYEDYGGNPRKMLSIPTFQETLTYYFTRVRPMGKIIETLNIGEILNVQLIKSPTAFKVEDSITVSDSCSAEAIRLHGDGVGVGQVISFNVESVRALSETLEMSEFLSYYKVANQWVNPGVSPPGSTNTLSLSWESFSVQLRNPILGDTADYSENQINRNTRGNDLIIFRDEQWPTAEVLHFEFEHLSLSQINELLEFMRMSLGRKITMIDQYNREWEGYILTPESEIVQNKRVGFKASFDFQGNLT